MQASTKLRRLLNQPKMVVAPGAIDCITARAIQRAGFDALYMTGAGTSMSLGYPDYGLITMSEMVANATRIAKSVSIPLISDADTGYGNELNVYRTVQEFERAGVAGIHIEDQVFPKRCGHLDSKEVVSREDFVAKIRAAAAAKSSDDFVIIARTDSRAVLGFQEAIERSRLALANGADLIFFEAPQTIDEVAKIPQLIEGPCLLNVVIGGKTPQVSVQDAEAMGYRIAIFPGLLLGSIMHACDEQLIRLKADGVARPSTQTSPATTFARFDSAIWDERRTAFRHPIDSSPMSDASALASTSEK
ncbi:MAG: carboxyvinyl-carboxyphosphonate phosphorylmutase [Betaproteobacteria bacterium]|nr:carboxyvinyl-carboxyphosphonate phosphorylmutase [Betaproteobacteria bacterium]NBP39031.1 carboxyvinyl-carboxyphosphonate phosphorylmutase [Betaproteobacteria bacterium]NBQ79010.1 carboxyvinyl-carboxyphosphonate phosphorylmutase [Betaproteobacteria bacterium]NBS40082.1 carboxyvinyl-carboxyphosphonate phosphorylmutase [Betaproteobacteria bacterium]NBT82363.1 carboxyvinyl-carboxyphosphonate phosphorylmutase [Betaproteobacteria bacterium]